MDAIAIHAALCFAVLGHPCFEVRERAPAIPCYIAMLGACHSDPEVAQRCASTAERRRVASIAALIEANRPLPWLDALGPEHSDRCEIISGFVQAAREMLPENIGHYTAWPEYRLGTELYLFTLSAAEARRVLAGMPRGKWWNGTAWNVVKEPVE